MLYRLYTERRDNLPEIVARFFPGFTLFDAVGFWDNVHEDTTIIEIIDLDGPEVMDHIHELADTIRTANGQHAVLITSHSINSELIGGESIAW